MTWRIEEWDVQRTPWPIEDESVQCVVTSPPYWGLRDYGAVGQLGLERTPDEYVEKMVSVFREVRRVLRKDGTLWLNLGDCFAGSWGNYGGQNRGAGTQREIVTGSQVPNPAYDGMEKMRPPTASVPGLKPKDLVGIPWRVAFALQADGWWLRSDIVWAKPNPMPESIRDRPTRAHEFVFLLTKSARYFYDQDAIREPFAAQGANARTVWQIATEPFAEAHFAVFPTELARRCILAGSRPGDLVLDPFSGAGTVALVSDMLSRDAIGLELNPKYVEMARKRISAPRSEPEAIRVGREQRGQTALFDTPQNGDETCTPTKPTSP